MLSKELVFSERQPARSFYMGKKIVCLIIACFTALTFVSCGVKTIAKDNGTDNKGGFVATTDNYVYFINGVESYSTAYKNGKVTKGALMRVAKDKFATDDAEYETVVSKMLVSDDKNAGFYIYGDSVYYAVPSLEKDKKGNAKSDQLNFFSTKLDASKTSSKIANKDFAHGATFRYIQSGDNVYLAVYSTDLYVYDAKTCKQVFTTEDMKGSVSEVVFDEDNASEYIYFSFKPVAASNLDESATTEENYHDIYRIKVGDKEAKVVFEGVGKAVADKTQNPDELIGLTADLLRHKDGKLYFSATTLNTVIGSGTIYYSLADNAAKASELLYKSEKRDENKNVVRDENGNIVYEDKPLYSNEKTTAAFADTVLYRMREGKLYTLYVDSALGLVQYDYSNAGDTNSSDYGVNVLSDNEKIKKATLSFISGDYLYFKDSDNNFCRTNLKNIENGEEAEIFRINTVALNNDWYKPEVITVGGKEYFVCVYSSSDYGSYLYSIDIAAVETAYKAAKTAGGDDFKDADFYSYDSKKEADKVKLGKLLGVKVVDKTEKK